MADTKISALTAASAVAGANEFVINEAGTSKKVTATQIKTFVDQAIRNASVSTPAAGFASDTYLVGSACAIPDGRLQAKTQYRVRFRVSKTNAGTTAPVITVRIGTAGTTADASRAALTFVAQTAAIDNGTFDIWCTFNSVGSGTSAVLEANGTLTHSLDITGLANVGSPTANNVGAGFNSTTAGSIIGLSVNGGTSAAWTITGVQADLINLI
jgi:hypothetical protein